jgi:hypothetical protein
MRPSRAAFVGAVLLCLGSPLGRGALARETWSEIRHVQILEGPEQICVFVEVARITDTGGLVAHLMSKHPDVEVALRSIFAIDRLRNVTEKTVAEDTGCGFDPDLNPIFRFSNTFYQYRTPSLDRPASLYRWDGDRFRRLDERESGEVERLLGDESYPRILDELKAISAREGWRCIYRAAVGFTEFAEPFASDRHQVRIGVGKSDQLWGPRSLRLSSVVASSVSRDKPWPRKLIEVDTKGRRGRRG